MVCSTFTGSAANQNHVSLFMEMDKYFLSCQGYSPIFPAAFAYHKNKQGLMPALLVDQLL